jgi:hypothetical protein
VQGKIRQVYLSAEVETKCHHCGQNLHLNVDSSMQIVVQEQGAEPWVFMPDMDWDHFAERTIIDAY